MGISVRTNVVLSCLDMVPYLEGVILQPVVLSIDPSCPESCLLPELFVPYTAIVLTYVCKIDACHFDLPVRIATKHI